MLYNIGKEKLLNILLLDPVKPELKACYKGKINLVGKIYTPILRPKTLNMH